MPPRPSNRIAFPAERGITITDAEHHLLTDVIGPWYDPEVQDYLDRAPATAGGRRLSTTHPAFAAFFAALGCEVLGYQKLDDERDNRPKRDSTAARLIALYDRIEGQLT
jgi:hypothetical protein